MTDLFIKPQYLKMITGVFDKYCPDAEVWAYGSRIKNEAHGGSDLDLVVKSFNSDKCNISELRSLLSDTYVPFLIDINAFDDLPESFQKEILNKYVVIYG